jgi:hypothetical protein
LTACYCVKNDISNSAQSPTSKIVNYHCLDRQIVLWILLP